MRLATQMSLPVGDVETAGALAVQLAPMAEPAEGALDNPKRFQDDEALLSWVLLNDVVAHAVEVAPLLSTGAEASAIVSLQSSLAGGFGADR